MSNFTKQARFIDYTALDAVSNMAIDEAMLEAHWQGLVPPTLRIYQFAPPAVSLGYSQYLDPLLIDKITAQGIAIVRRPTGGRAVLHVNDLTYSFVGSSANLVHNPSHAGAPVLNGIILAASVTGAYRQICRGLVLAFAQFGINLEMGLNKTIRNHSHDCFQATTAADLQHEGKKMIGSAQMRRKHAVLQHGSIILNQPQDLMAELTSSTADPDEGEVKIVKPAHHANLFQAVGRQIPLEELQLSLKSGFEQAFGVSFIASPLTEAELSLAQQLRPKYESKA